MKQEELISLICKKVVEKLNDVEAYKIPIGVSNRHVHLSREHYEILFGKNTVLTKKVDLKQPDQFAANETVTIRGPKGEFKKVRILGPFRDKSQVEISVTDSFRLGVKPMIKESGQLDGTPGIEIIGPEGSVKLENGTIVALRHIHMTNEDAKRMGVKDGQLVDVQLFGPRKATLSNVLVRVSDKYKLEMHLDMDEANSALIKNNDIAILKK